MARRTLKQRSRNRHNLVGDGLPPPTFGGALASGWG
jgi:hypothetical protein